MNLMQSRQNAKVYQSEPEACGAILSGEVSPGTVIVLRYEGPKGGPGMPEMYRPMKCLEGMGLASSCAIVPTEDFPVPTEDALWGIYPRKHMRGEP